MTFGRKEVEGNRNLRNAGKEYFSKLYMEEYDWRLSLGSISFLVLDEGSKADLERCFTKEEILKGLRVCRNDKALGPDDFNMGFLSAIWDMFKGDFVDFFNELHDSGRFVKFLFDFHCSDSKKSMEPLTSKNLEPLAWWGVYVN